MGARLPSRPVGVRKSWLRKKPDLAKLGELLRSGSWIVSPDWGDPVEGWEFRERSGRLRRVEALYPDGRHVSISIHKSGKRISRVSRISAEASA